MHKIGGFGARNSLGRLCDRVVDSDHVEGTRCDPHLKMLPSAISNPGAYAAMRWIRTRRKGVKLAALAPKRLGNEGRRI